MVGPENPDFRSLEQIPPFLKSAGHDLGRRRAFSGHRGFLLEPFKESIAANLRQGASCAAPAPSPCSWSRTSSSRGRRPSPARLEEMIITWLIEENRLVSKARMLEIYLNIIEWGPGSLRRPGGGALLFRQGRRRADPGRSDLHGQHHPPAQALHGVVRRRTSACAPGCRPTTPTSSAKMLQKGWIGQRDVDALIADVRLQGPARLLLKGHEVGPDGSGGDIR
ncbi:MAG: transglycosylase domain-containing protein [Candidatus Moduliflexus flocculans]|nr:transglycosylase domain-containing protein [Candidatus Moduliflexus flocculans]